MDRLLVEFIQHREVKQNKSGADRMYRLAIDSARAAPGVTATTRMNGAVDAPGIPPLAPELRGANPARWLVIFGPGAIIASLTIGTGELIFSSRAGALFGYDILWLFLLTCVLKWVLVFSSARHMVLSGVHPFERWCELPGTRGWFPLVFLVAAVIAFPIWIGFHAGVIGSFAGEFLGGDKHLWGAVIIAAITPLVLRGGYGALEKIQLVIVAGLLVATSVSLVLLGPSWGDLLAGFFVPTSLEYPPWLAEAAPKVAARPIWVETATYVGVIGGSAFDYLAYVSFLRHKAWGLSAGGGAATDLSCLAGEERKALRAWIRAPLVDCAISFAVVLAFSGVFVASGRIVLGPQHQLPSGDHLLGPQSEFLTQLHPWLLPLYVVGAALALIGTLYGTIEVAPAVFSELLRAFGGRMSAVRRRAVVLWVTVGGLVVLAWSFASSLEAGATGRPPTLVGIITPANLFTGVLACGLVCLLNPWMDWRFLPRGLRMGWPLALLNGVAAVLFLAIGAKGYWDFAAQQFPNAGAGGGWLSLPLFGATLAVGWIAAWFLARRR